MGFGLGCGRAGDAPFFRVAVPKVVIASPLAIPLPESPTETRYSLPRSARLRGDATLKYIWKFGLYQREGPLSLKALFFPVAISGPAIKAALLVRKKVFRRAAKRNRVRRLLREAHRHLCPEWALTLGTAEAWLLWIWEGTSTPSLRELFPFMNRLYQKAYQRWERSLFF